MRRTGPGCPGLSGAAIALRGENPDAAVVEVADQADLTCGAMFADDD
jgi:hypothetical protein